LCLPYAADFDGDEMSLFPIKSAIASTSSSSHSQSLLIHLMAPSIWKCLAPLTVFLQQPPLASALTMSNIYSSNTPSKRCHVRVASYKVLSSHLASPSYFSTLNPDHLAANNRLLMFLQKLDQEMQQKAILCLQEVSYT
jgi:hypothetical protein